MMTARSSALALFAFTLALLGSACTPTASEEEEDDRPRARPASSAPASAPTASEAAGPRGTGVVSGIVRYSGPPPVNERFTMASDSFCKKAHPNDVEKEQIVLGADQGLANTFVWVKEGVSGRYASPTTPVLLDQNGCTYRPHVIGAMVGQPIEIRNSDETIHNVHALAEKNDSFNFGMPLKDLKTQKVFDKPEVMIKIKCDVHGWMSAYAGIVPHPFFAVSGPDGSFSIRELPVGTYTVEAWHEKLGVQTQQVVVGEGETKTAAFTFKAVDR